jgi:hypothetical protein
MRRGLSQDVRTTIIAIVVAAVVAAPAAAAIVANSDMVDGKHAVTAGANRSSRAGKLVATNTNGYLPNDIVVKARDSNLFDGKDSTEFLGATAQAADANTLDGKDSTEFLGATAQAADANTLDGKDSTQLAARRVTASKSGWEPVTPTTSTYMSVTITAPTQGTVVVNGSAYFTLEHRGNYSSYFYVGIVDDSDLVPYMAPGVGIHQVPWSETRSMQIATTLPVQSIFNVEPGTHTYYMNARANTGFFDGYEGNYIFIATGQLVATFIPN